MILLGMLLFIGSELMFFHGLVGVPILFLLVPAGEYALVCTIAGHRDANSGAGGNEAQ